MFHFFLQMYIGSSQSAVFQNENILQDLAVEMMIAVKGDSFPRISKVTNLPATPNLQSLIGVNWYHQQKAAHKPRWLQFFLPSTQTRSIMIEEIVLYDFDLTKKGALKKKSRDYLQEHFM